MRGAAAAAVQPESPATEGLRSLEVRWIFPGQLEAAVAVWFGRFAATRESREDAYFLDPHLPQLSVKIRGGEAFEVKVYDGSPGILDMAGCARGRMESWQKWSFPCNPPGQYSDNPAEWMLIRKRRRIARFALADGPAGVRLPGPGGESRCAVELTEVSMRGDAWWTLGFEATGPTSELRSELEAAAALVFAQTPPDGLEFAVDDSRSYAEWLCRRPPTERDTDA